MSIHVFTLSGGHLKAVWKLSPEEEPFKCDFFYFYIYTVGTESIQTPLNLSVFVILQPFYKII